MHYKQNKSTYEKALVLKVWPRPDHRMIIVRSLLPCYVIVPETVFIVIVINLKGIVRRISVI